ncbi:hypothetical protein HCN44_001206 [Aphidius gifuensis]|uniref:Peptidase S1 domain-containing protein n=1 Tax=Aphidius gifuensis TaxID=684658 RepID=A0A834XJZ9_APHGI|nr:hypothetical protein HCN44_001206 [Aphidius gifuensis]
MPRIIVCILLILITVVHGKLPNKIFDGHFVTENYFPYLVSVGTPIFGSCSGSIITRQHVLTSAHCVCLRRNIVETEVLVLSGTNDLLDIINGQIHDVELIILYETYDPPREVNDDIAILKLADPIEFTMYRRPISLPSTDHIPHGEQVMIGGWGVISLKTDFPSRYLKYIFLKILSDRECQALYPSEIDSTHFCGVTPQRLGGGDSGGPVVYNNEIIGVITSAQDEDEGPATSVFTRTWLYKSWITKVINQY